MVDVFDEIVEDDFQIKAVDAMAVVLWAGTLRARPMTTTFAALIPEKCLTDPPTCIGSGALLARPG